MNAEQFYKMMNSDDNIIDQMVEWGIIDPPPIKNATSVLGLAPSELEREKIKMLTT